MTPTHSYIARRKHCGCLVKTALDIPANARQNVREVCSWLRLGLEVDYVPNEVVAEQIVLWCGHQPPTTRNHHHAGGRQRRRTAHGGLRQADDGPRVRQHGVSEGDECGTGNGSGLS